LLSLYAETPAAAGQRAHAKLIFQGYLKLVVFTMQYAETGSVRPATEGHPPAGKGGVSFGSQLGFESPAFH
jgi:hypothetical protein